MLEFVADFEAQKEYDASAAVFTWWEDWFDPKDLAYYAPPLYTPEETRALMDFHQVWEIACDQTPKHLPPIVEVQQWPIWLQLRAAAEDALAVFMKRGKFSEEE